MAQRTTLKDIAQAVGLSTTTVSMVLNKRPIKISEKKRTQILEKARQMEYKTNRAARVRTAPAKRIGVILSNVDGFFSDALDGIERRVSRDGYTALLGQSFNQADTEHKVLSRLIQNRVAGLIVSTSNETLFEGVDTPVVLFNSELPTLNYSQITFNECKGAFLATKHLLTLGHRKIACLAGEAKKNAEGRIDSPRLDGYFWAFAEAGLPSPENSVFFGDYLDAQSGYKYLDAVLEGGFTALFCCNDLLAYGVYRRAIERKLNIPRDLSIVGFDDISFSSLLTPSLTTVHQSGFRVGHEAADRLLYELGDENAPHQSIRFEPTLVIRESTRPLI